MRKKKKKSKNSGDISLIQIQKKNSSPSLITPMVLANEIYEILWKKELV